MAKVIQLSIAWLPSWMLIVVLGCAQLPDVKPFAEATGNLATAVSSIQSPTATAIANTFDPTSLESKRDAATRAMAFKAIWADRVRVVNAFASYSEGLVAVAAAGENGEVAAKQVTDEFRQLIDALRPGLGANTATSAVFAVADKIAAEIIRQQAARTLAEAVNRNQGYARELADALSKDWETAKSLIDSSYDQMMTVALRQTEKNRTAIIEIDKIRPEIRKLLITEATRHGIADEAILAIPEGPAREAAKQAHDKRVKEIADAGARLELLDSYYNSIVNDPAYQKGDERFNDLVKQKAELIALVDQAALVTTQWAAAHADLGTALRERRPVSFKRLLQLSEELLEIYKIARKK